MTDNKRQDVLDRMLVGGAVRDKLLGKVPIDRDWLVLNKTSKEMLDMGFKRVGNSSTAPVFIHPTDALGEEYAIPRKEISTGDGYKDFEFETENVTVNDDLERRDFTINSMALTTYGILVDPFNGQKDLEDKVIRHTNSTSFVEDPLRVLRAARFAARFDFKVHEDTKKLCRRMCDDGMLDGIAGERVYLELKKALVQVENPSNYFIWLLELGALEVIYPELYAMLGVPQPEEHHQEGDVYDHTMLALDVSKGLGADVPTMIAVLFHDIGKTLTKKYLWPSHKNHTGSEAVWVFNNLIADRMNMDNKTRQKCVNSIRYHMKYHLLEEMRAGSVNKIFRACKVKHTMEYIDSLIIVGMSDERGRLPVIDNHLHVFWKKLAECFAKHRVVIPEGEYSAIARANMAVQQENGHIKAVKSNLGI